MRQYPTGRTGYSRRMQVWVAENDALRRHIVRQLRTEGPLRLRDFEDRAVVGWKSSGWTTDRNVERMLDYLWIKGRIVVAGRPGGQKLWDLAERWLPAWTPRERLSEPEVVRFCVERSVRALGVAQPGHIQQHFTRGRYPGLPGALAWLQRKGRLHPVRVADGAQVLPGPWFVHQDDLPALERLEAGEWNPRTTLLSPFDNLICDRSRTELLFGFRFRMEIYVPKADRKFGYYVLPILHGDRLIGRVDPLMDRATGRLEVKAVHAEPGAPITAAGGRAVRAALDDLARFLDASDLAFIGPVPEGWSKELR
jgi:uncharacterized protein